MTTNPTAVHYRKLLITAPIAIGIAWLVFILRFWSRAIVLRSFGADDMMALIALVSLTIFSASIAEVSRLLVTDGTEAGPSLQATLMAVNLTFVADAFYIVTMLAFKVALGLFFLRIMTISWHRRIVYAALAISTVINLAYFFLIIFQCGVPPSAMEYLLRDQRGNCITQRVATATSYTQAIIVCLTDWVFVVLPLCLIQDLRQARMKITTYFILVLAVAGSICSLLRIPYIYQMNVGETAYPNAGTNYNILTIMEPSIGLIASSLATLRPLLRLLGSPKIKPFLAPYPLNNAGEENSSEKTQTDIDIEIIARV